MVKMLIVQNIGIVLGDVLMDDPHDPDSLVKDGIKIHYPMIMGPTEQGKMAAQVNPMFRESLVVNPKYVVGEASVVTELAEQYETYLRSKQSKLILPQTQKIQL